MTLQDATGLGLVDVGPLLPGLLYMSDLRRQNSIHQSYIVVDRPTQAERDALAAYLRNYRPGGPMGPMREMPYRDWPPAREGWRR